MNQQNLVANALTSGKWISRHRVVTALLTLLSISIAFGVCFSVYFAWAAKAEINRTLIANSQLENAELQARTLLSQTESLLNSSQDGLYALSLSTAVSEWEYGSAAEARNRLSQSPRASRGWEYHALAKLMNEGSTVLATNEPVMSLAISPDGKRLAIGGMLVINNKEAQLNVRMRNADTGELMYAVAGHSNHVNGIRFHPDGKLFATCSDDRLIKVWESDLGTLVATLEGHSLGVTSIDFNADGSQLVSCGRDGQLKLWNFGARECIASWNFHPGQEIQALAVRFSPSGKIIASGGQDGRVRLWDTATNQEKLDYKQHESRVSYLCFIDESRLVSVSEDGTCRQWNLKNNQLDAALEQHKGGAFCVASIPSRSLFATCGADNRIRLWDSDNHQLHRDLVGHENAVYSIAASPDGRWLYTSSLDRTIRRWELSRLNQPIVIVPPHSKFTSNLVVTPNGSQVVRGLQSGQIGFFQIESGELERISNPLLTPIVRLAIDRSGQTLASIRGSGELDVLNAVDFSVLGSKTDLPGSRGLARRCFNFFPGRPWLAIGAGKDVIIWDYESDEEVSKWEAHEFPVGNLQFSRDGERLYSSSISGAYGIKIWETKSWTEVDHLGRSNTSSILELDPTGNLLMTNARGEHELVLWDTHSLEHRFTFPKQRSSIVNATFSVAANRVAIIGGSDNSDSIQLWNLSTGTEVVRFQEFGLGYPPRTVPFRNAEMTFSRDGTKLLIAEQDAIYVWDGRAPFKGHSR